MSIIIDCETVPQSREILEAKLPEDLRNPKMPEDLVNAEEPNWQERVPAYGLPELKKKLQAIEQERCEFIEAGAPRETLEGDDDKTKKGLERAREAWNKKNDSLNAKAEAASSAVTDAVHKQEAWIKESSEKWHIGLADAKSDWELKVIEAKAARMNKAALDPRSGHVRIIGMKEAGGGTRMFIWEPRKEVIAKVREWVASLPYFDKEAGAGAREFRGSRLIVSEYREEAAMLKAFFSAFYQSMIESSLDPVEGEKRKSASLEEKNCITFYGHIFDFPFLYRRAWILGVPQAPLFRRGRYFKECMVDLQEIWTFGSRDEKTGGLEALAVTLGAPAGKVNDSGTFSEWYEKDPVEGICHCINDLELTEFCAEKIGVIR